MDFVIDSSLVLYLPLYIKDSGSFLSRDEYGHLCTVTGALWTPQGRSFDGSDDKINLGTPGALNFGAGSYTIEAWCFTTAAAMDRAYFGSRDPANRRRISLRSNAFSRCNNAGVLAEIYPNGGPSLSANIFHHLVGIYDAAAGKLISFLDIETRKEANASGTLDPAAANYAGADPGQGGGDRWWLAGLIGEMRIYNRALSPLEVQQNWLATKWRYR